MSPRFITAFLSKLERFLPPLPGGLIVLLVGTTGLPTVPDVRLGDLWVLLPSAARMLLVIFSDALGAGQTLADNAATGLIPARR